MDQQSVQELQASIKSLKKQLKFAYLIFATAAILLAVIYAEIPSQANGEVMDKSNQIIRARGLILVDEKGRERILLGAPVPAAKNRVRTDMAKVKNAWGYLDERYLDFYKKYKNDMDGLLVLDENGFDRLAIGDRVPDPNTGTRISSNQTGLLINDEKGFERTGYGVLNVKGINRVVLGLDNNKGTEGAVLFVRDDGGVGLTMRDKKQNIYLGSAPPKFGLTKLDEPFLGLLIKDADRIKYKFNGIAGEEK